MYFSYCDMFKKMKRYLFEVVEDLIKNFDVEFGLGKYKEILDFFYYFRYSYYLDSDEEELLCDSLFN